MFHRALITGLLLLIMSGCAPMQSSSFKYIPPKDDIGRRCVNSCLNQKETCDRECTSNKTTCQIMEDTKGYMDYLVNNDPSRSNPHKFSSLRQDCNLDFMTCKSSCQANYRMCYTNCGGEVLESSN